MTDTDQNLRDGVEKQAVDTGSSSDNGSPTGWGEKMVGKRGSISCYDREAHVRHGGITHQHDGFFSASNPSSFKRNPNARVVTEATDSEGWPLRDQPPAEPALELKLKERHLQMITIGGSIGTSRFVGSGSALSTGGPASLVLVESRTVTS